MTILQTFFATAAFTAVIVFACLTVQAEDVNVVCTCKITPLKTVDPFTYVIKTSVPAKEKVTPETLAYACYQQRDKASAAAGACMEGKDRDTSLSYFTGRLQN